MTGYRDQNLALFIGIVIFSLRVSCATGSTQHIMKVVSAGKSVSLDCIVPKDVKVEIYWKRDDYSTFIAYAGIYADSENIFKYLENKRIALNYTKSWNTTVSVFTITIWNITYEDSSSYTCETDILSNGMSVTAYSYDVQVIDCACSAIDGPLRCFLNGYITEDCISVHIKINGSYIAKSRIHPPNEIIASPWNFQQDRRNDIEIQVSSVQSSTTDIDVVCVLPALDQASPPSSPLLSAASTPPRATLSKSSSTVATMSPTCQTIQSTPKTSSSISEINRNTNRKKVASSKPYTEMSSTSTFMSSTGSRLDPTSKASSKWKDDSLRATASMRKKVTIIVVLSLSGALFLGMVIVMFFWKRKRNNHKPACSQIRGDGHKKVRKDKQSLELLTARQHVIQVGHDSTIDTDQNKTTKYTTLNLGARNTEDVHEYEDVGQCTDSEDGKRSIDKSHVTTMFPHKTEDEDGYLIPSISANCEKHNKYIAEDYECVFQNYTFKNHIPAVKDEKREARMGKIWGINARDESSMSDIDGYVVPTFTGQEKRELNKDRDGYMYLLPTGSRNTGGNTRIELHVDGHGYCPDNFYDSVN